jgi:plastocyanin
MDMPGMEMAEAEHEEEHNELAEVMHMEGDEHPPEEHEDEYAEDEEEDEHAEGEEEDEHAEEEEPIDVYMIAERYYYDPAVLRLERGVPYNFRMMAMDTGHGISVLGNMSVSVGGHMMRSPVGQVAEMVMNFQKTGEYMVYCTVYCGEGHEFMTATIIVEEPVGDMA